MIYVVAPDRQQAGDWLREFGKSDQWDDPEIRVICVANGRDFYRIHGYRWQDGDEFVVTGRIDLTCEMEACYIARYIGVPEELLEERMVEARGL